MSGDGQPVYVHGQAEGLAEVCLRAELDPDGRSYVRVSGKCPRCKHEISKRISALAGGEFLAADGRGLRASGVEGSPVGPLRTGNRDEPHTYLVNCNCTYGHQDAPRGVRGCGWQASVCIMPREGGEPEVKQVSGDVGAWDKDEYVERASSKQLQKVRRFAGQWTAMLGVVTGFLAVGTFFDLTKKDLGLHGPAWVVYVAGALVALAAAVGSVARGSQAAGLQHFDRIPADTEGRVHLEGRAVKNCRDWLSQSKRLALVSVVALAVAVAARLAG